MERELVEQLPLCAACDQDRYLQARDEFTTGLTDMDLSEFAADSTEVVIEIDSGISAVEEICLKKRRCNEIS